MFSYEQYSSFMGMTGICDRHRMKSLQIRSKVREIWHSNWIDLMFNQAQNIFESNIKNLADLGGERLSNEKK